MLNNLKQYLILVGIPVLVVGFIAILGLYVNHKSTQAQNQLAEFKKELNEAGIKLGAPAVFISTPSTSTATGLQNFSFTIGTTTPRGIFGSSTLAVYGSTTIHTWRNTLHALEVFDSATSTVFRVDTINRLSSTSALTISNLISCDTIDTNASGVLACGADAGGAAIIYDAWTHPTPFQSATTSLMIFNGANGGFISNSSSTISALYVSASTTLTGHLSASSSISVAASSTFSSGINIGGIAQVNDSLIVSGNIQSTLNDRSSLGISGTGFSDLFLASGAVVNFAAGNLTVTHSSGLLTVAGAFQVSASSTFQSAFNIGGALTVNGNSILRASSTVQGVINVGGDSTGTSTFNSGIRIRAGCYENASSTCLTTRGLFTIHIASSTMSTTTDAAQHKLPFPINITRVSCSTDFATSTVQLDLRTEALPDKAGTNLFPNFIFCIAHPTQSSTTNALIPADAPINFQIRSQPAGGNTQRPGRLRIHVEYFY